MDNRTREGIGYALGLCELILCDPETDQTLIESAEFVRELLRELLRRADAFEDN